jgi:hypothetical protein
MKDQLIAFARDVDTFCGRLNDGLTAVAILLGFLVVTMSVIRGQDLVPDTMLTVPPVVQAAVN